MLIAHLTMIFLLSMLDLLSSAFAKAPLIATASLTLLCSAVWACLLHPGHIGRLLMLRQGKPPVGKVDLCEGALSVFVREYEAQLLRTQRGKTGFFNLVDLCGASRTCMNEATSEWWLNRRLDLVAVKSLRDLTVRSHELLNEAAQLKHWAPSQRSQIDGMISNVLFRVKTYDVILDQNLSLETKAAGILELSGEMERLQSEVAAGPKKSGPALG